MKKPFWKTVALITLAISLRRHYPDQVKGFTLSLGYRNTPNSFFKMYL